MAPAHPGLRLRMYHDWKGLGIKANAEFVLPGRDMADRTSMAYLLAGPVQEHDLYLVVHGDSVSLPPNA